MNIISLTKTLPQFPVTYCGNSQTFSEVFFKGPTTIPGLLCHHGPYSLWQWTSNDSPNLLCSFTSLCLSVHYGYFALKYSFLLKTTMDAHNPPLSCLDMSTSKASLQECDAHVIEQDLSPSRPSVIQSSFSTERLTCLL